MKPRVLFVGLESPEIKDIVDKIDCLSIVYENLPAVKLIDNKLFAESRFQPGKFLKIDKVVYHGIYENDFDFLTLLALWGGDCFPNATGMMDCRLRLPGLARALKVTKFGKLLRGMSLQGETWESARKTVAKWGNWHCGENKALFDKTYNPVSETTLYEDFITGEAVRIFLVEDKYWQIRLGGDDWLKSIHHNTAAEMSVDVELLEDTRNLARHFGLEVVGVDYMVSESGDKYLLEVNHIPNVTVFSFVREAYLNLVCEWINEKKVS
jgi:hypothetical protein